MSLTIIIPTLNEAEHLAALLPSLTAALPHAELIVADGGSTDTSRDVLARTPSARWLDAPRGRARQMNAAAHLATGDVLLFLHADTRLPPSAGGAIAQALADPRVIAGRFDVALDSPRPLLRVVEALMNARSRLTGICTGDQTLFVRRADFDAVGGYPDIPLMEDIALSRRLKRRGRVAALRLRVTTSARKWEREGAVRTILLMWALRLAYTLGVPPARLHRWYYGRDPAPPAVPSAR